MASILTADQFVAGVIATLALKDLKRFVLKDSELDEMFELAFGELVENEANFDVTPNFTFYTDPIHGDSVVLRETLLAAREKELIAVNNPTFHTFDIKLDLERARRYLERSPLPKEFFEQLVTKHFSSNIALSN